MDRKNDFQKFEEKLSVSIVASMATLKGIVNRALLETLFLCIIQTESLSLLDYAKAGIGPINRSQQGTVKVMLYHWKIS